MFGRFAEIERRLSALEEPLGVVHVTIDTPSGTEEETPRQPTGIPRFIRLELLNLGAMNLVAQIYTSGRYQEYVKVVVERIVQQQLGVADGNTTIRDIASCWQYSGNHVTPSETAPFDSLYTYVLGPKSATEPWMAATATTYNHTEEDRVRPDDPNNPGQKLTSPFENKNKTAIYSRTGKVTLISTTITAEHSPPDDGRSHNDTVADALTNDTVNELGVARYHQAMIAQAPALPTSEYAQIGVAKAPLPGSKDPMDALRAMVASNRTTIRHTAAVTRITGHPAYTYILYQRATPPAEDPE
ncbi:MAG: hypothetical protein LBJ69_01620 [Holosporales bacterium]|jgi:hypothetical protein|nr:hypothetical protein [Holosporales bacterium]